MRKIRLSTTEGRVLWILEEAGEETMTTLLITMREEGVSAEQTIAAIENLLGLGFLRRDADYLILTESGFECLSR